MLWEELERAVITRSARVSDHAFDVALHFRGGGYSEYEARGGVADTREPVAGTQGLIPRRDFKKTRPVAGNVDRWISSAYLVSEAEHTGRDIAKALEARMDSYKLDLSYRLPKLKRVTAGR
jgi:hypothetical protein